MTITASDLLVMSDNDIGTHASGGYGAKKRNEFIAAVRRAASLAQQADAEAVTFAGLMGERARGIYAGPNADGPSAA